MHSSDVAPESRLARQGQRRPRPASTTRSRASRPTPQKPASIMRFTIRPARRRTHWTRAPRCPRRRSHQRIHARWPLQQIPPERSEDRA